MNPPALKMMLAFDKVVESLVKGNFEKDNYYSISAPDITLHDLEEMLKKRDIPDFMGNWMILFLLKYSIRRVPRFMMVLNLKCEHPSDRFGNWRSCDRIDGNITGLEENYFDSQSARGAGFTLENFIRRETQNVFSTEFMEWVHNVVNRVNTILKTSEPVFQRDELKSFLKTIDGVHIAKMSMYELGLLGCEFTIKNDYIRIHLPYFLREAPKDKRIAGPVLSKDGSITSISTDGNTFIRQFTSKGKL